MIVALVALSSSLASGATAVTLLTGGDIANRSLTGKDLKASSVTTKHVKDRSLLKRDFRKGHLLLGQVGPVGPAGPEGAQGPAGPAGPAGEDGADGADGAAGAKGADGADGANGAAGADGADGVDGADGAQGPPGPPGGNVIASGYETLGPVGNLPSGTTDLFAPAFTAGASGVCVVTAQVSIDNSGANANNTVSVRSIRKVDGGATTTDGGWENYVMADGDAEGSGAKTALHTISEGSSYQLGVRITAAGDSVGDVAYPTVTYFCL